MSKIIGLMPIGNGDHKRDFGAAKCLAALCDGIIFSHQSRVVPPASGGIIEIVTIGNMLPWHDYNLRMTLLARAAAHDGTFVIWADSDETIEPAITKEIIQRQIREMLNSGCIAVRYRTREMWTPFDVQPMKWRSDGLWADKSRIVIQRNPLMDEFVYWRAGIERPRFHCWPLQIGDVAESNAQLLHWGMCTPELRKLRYEKWKRLDPENKWQGVGYDYMMDDSTLELTELKASL